MSEPTVKQAISGPDPWETARMQASAGFDQAEESIAEAVRLAMARYLALVRDAIMQDRPAPAPGMALVAASMPNLSLWPDDSTWIDLIRAVIAKIVKVWDAAFGRSTRETVIDPIQYRNAFLRNVYSRLSESKWPQAVWTEVHHEISESLQLGESIDRLGERLADLLKINALSRTLRDEAARLRAIRDDPDSTPAQRADARARLRQVYADLDDANLMWLYDVRRIARTETQTAVNGGAYTGAVAVSAETGQPMVKRWLATRDTRVRDTHSAIPGVGADGQVRDLLEPFDVGGSALLFPGDPAGPAHEVIQCRCTATFHDADEADQLRAAQTTVVASGGNDMNSNTWGTKRGLPSYVKEVEKALRRENGWDRGRAIATAKNAVRRWCSGGGDVDAATRAKACRAVAEMEAGKTGSADTPAFAHADALGFALSDAALADLPNVLRGDSDDSDADDYPDDDERGLPGRWRGVLAVLDQLTGDRRILATPPSGEIRLGPHMPLQWQERLGDGHDDAVSVGLIDRAWIDDGHVMGEGRFNLGTEAGRKAAGLLADGWVKGVSLDPDDVVFSRMCHNGTKMIDCPDMGDSPEPGDKPDDGVFPVMVFDDWRIRAATMVNIPAFADALIEPVWDDEEGGETADLVASAGSESATLAASGDTGLTFAPRTRAWDSGQARKRMLQAATDSNGDVDAVKLSRGFLYKDADADPDTASAYKLPFADIIGGELRAVWHGVSAAAAALQGARGGVAIPDSELSAVRSKAAALYRRASEEFDDPSLVTPWERDEKMGVCEPCMGRARALVASGPIAPPSFWFEDPHLDAVTPVTITADGRVFGHVAGRGQCHTAFPGRCQTPPIDGCDFTLFHHGEVITSDGGHAQVGALIVGTDHAPLRANAMSAMRHYADTGSAVAIVRAGVDGHGLWIAGSLTADATDLQVYTLRRSSLSGDWREIDGRIHFVAALAVNVPGFPIERRHEREDRVRAMVAVGAVGAPMHVHVDGDVNAARLAELRERVARAKATIDQTSTN